MQISFTVSNYNGTNVSCFGSKDGSITVHVTGGTPPYTYLWSNDATTATITGCSADYYGVTVTDSTGTMAEDGINLTSPAILKPILNAYEYNNGYNISLYGASNGSITTTVDGGVSPFSFEWEDGPATQNRSMLGGGFYNLIVTDANNCLANVQTILSEPERDDWTMNGNANSNPATQFIGTTDAKDFVVKTNGAERMRFTSGGDVHTKKIIADTIRVNRIMSLLGDSVIHLGDSSISINPNNNIGWTPLNAFKGLGIGNSNGSSAYPRPMGLGINSLAMGNGSVYAYGNYSLALGSTSTLAYGLNSVAIGGNIGTGSNGTHSIAIGDCYPLTGTAQYFNDKPNSLGITFNSNQATLFVGPGNGTGTTGNVGIGTTTIPAGFKLAVNGNIICTEVKVKLYANWPPDFVFDEKYKLMSLVDLRKFIEENHHLPDIFSAAEMKKDDGISVGDFQMRLLQKIEEQALYILDQDKRLNEQEKRIARLENEKLFKK